MALQYVKSQKGRDQLLYKGYLHKKERVIGDKTLWKCADYHKYRCRGRAHTCDDHVIKYSPHLHPPSNKKAAAAAATAKRIASLKDVPSPSQESSHKIIMANSSGLPEAAADKKSHVQRRKRAIQLLRARLNASCQRARGVQPWATVAETISEDPSLAQSPDLHECSDTDESLTHVPCDEARASHSMLLQPCPETAQQRFRKSTIRTGDTPQETLSSLSEEAHQWLCPQKHSKDQIVDMIILEQFLNMLPADVQKWVKAREPGNSKEAGELTEAYYKEQEPIKINQVLGMGFELVTFEDVSLHFTEEEWALLSHGEKALYWDVMHQNYDNVTWLAKSGTASKNEKDPRQETYKPMVELAEESERKISSRPDHELVREISPKRQLKSSLEEEVFICFRNGVREQTRGIVSLENELEVKTQCACTDCGKSDESPTLSSGRKSYNEQDSVPLVQPMELKERSENITETSEQTLVNNSVERQQSTHSGTEDERVVLFGTDLRDPVFRDTPSGQQLQYICCGGGSQDDSLMLSNNQKIYGGKQSRCEELLEISEISQNPDLVTYSDLSSTELDGTDSCISNKIAALGGEDQEVQERRQQTNSSGTEEGKVKSMLVGMGFRGLAKGLVHLDPLSKLESMDVSNNCAGPDGASEQSDGQKSSDAEGLCQSPKRERRFTQSSDLVPESKYTCRENDTGGPSTFMKHRSFDKRDENINGRLVCLRSRTNQKMPLGRKRQKHFSLENWWCCRPSGYRLLKSPKRRVQTQSTVHCSPKCNAQPAEALQLPTETCSRMFSSASQERKHWQISSSVPLVDQMAAKPIAGQFMALLEQVASDTAEIKSTISSLHATVTGIQKALGNLSVSTDEAEHRISDLEHTSQNTKVQLVQHGADIKAIEAKLSGNTVQSNTTIPGLCSSLKVQRGPSPLCLTLKSQ